eukprot:6207536-Pleurochrysis_carterae.AAC.2
MFACTCKRVALFLALDFLLTRFVRRTPSVPSFLPQSRLASISYRISRSSAPFRILSLSLPALSASRRRRLCFLVAHFLSIFFATRVRACVLECKGA